MAEGGEEGKRADDAIPAEYGWHRVRKTSQCHLLFLGETLWWVESLSDQVPTRHPLPLRDAYSLLLGASFIADSGGATHHLSPEVPEPLAGLCREHAGGATRRAEKGVEDQQGRLVCRWDLSGVGRGRGPDAPVFVHRAQELLNI